LNDGDRLVLWLADVERVSHGAIARLIGIDADEVRNRHYRARLTLSLGAARHLRAGGAQGAEA
jgi:DNA-directed RNA polymerase specialized sigma24 family protein